VARLTTAERNALPDSAFAGPNRTYPVEDAAHARNAKSRAAQFAGASLKKRVDARANKVLGKGSAAKAMVGVLRGGK
jgi:hypothetical protein